MVDLQPLGIPRGRVRIRGRHPRSLDSQSSTLPLFHHEERRLFRGFAHRNDATKADDPVGGNESGVH